MNVKQIIEQEMKRSPDKWINNTVLRIDEAYKKNNGMDVKEYNLDLIYVITLMVTVSFVSIIIGIYVLM